MELHDAGAAFAVLGGYAVAFHGHPRATKDLDVRVRAEAANANSGNRALAQFGAPLRNFQVSESDFASRWVLPIAWPPRRIAILNHADGISFDEAIADGAAARRLRDLGRPVRVRFVLVPGHTDAPDNVAGLARFCAELENVQRVEVLPFRQLGRFKWHELGVPYALESV